MKKFVLILLIASCPIIGHGQILLGPKIGGNMSWQNKNAYTVPKFALMYGVALDIHITNAFSVQGEFLVSHKGQREEYNGKTIFDELTATYLEIPALAKYSHMGVNWGFYTLGGISWSYWTKGVYESSVDGVNSTIEDYPFQPTFDAYGYKDVRSDFGLILEAGFTYDNLGSGVLSVGLRYTHGLRATNDYKFPPADAVMKKNRVLSLSVTYFMYF